MKANQKNIKNYLKDLKPLYFLGLSFLIILLIFSACKPTEEESHVSTKIDGNLDGLEQPANQTVFSDVKTIEATERKIQPVVNATGLVTYDPRLLKNISARFGGRIEKLYLRYNFEKISKGQRIMDIYSPEILTEQQNLIFLIKNSPKELALIYSSKQKLQIFGLTSEQIDMITGRLKPINPLPVYSPFTGHIHDIGSNGNVNSTEQTMSGAMSTPSSDNRSEKNTVQIENLPSSQNSAISIKEGMYVKRGQPIFNVYNIDKIWAIFNVFQKDAAFIKVGDKIAMTAETNPVQLIPSFINYIEPLTGQNASTIKIRVYLNNNENHFLKIGTLLSAKITTKEIVGLWLPRTAVVNLGQKQIVFFRVDNRFTARQVKTGAINDSFIQITEGLKLNEKVASNAQYMVDSESFIKYNDNE